MEEDFNIHKEENGRSSKEKFEKFEGKIGEYKRWRVQVEDWFFQWGDLWKHPGIQLRNALRGEAWEMVGDLKTYEIQGKEGYGKILEILDRRYSIRKECQKLNIMNEMYRIERRMKESITDYVNRFQMVYRRCKSVG